jgi:hypothetical protein
MRTSVQWCRLVALLSIVGGAPATARAGVRVPLFARQTNRMCSACHSLSHFPELTAMGRVFKLNGYRLSKIDSLLGDIEENTATGSHQLLLNLATSLGFMMYTSYASLQRPQPGTQNGTVLFPEQLSIFLGGRLSPRVGAFVQITYHPQAGTFGMDNTDLRFADSVRLLAKNAIVGISLNNNPTVQDLWNSTPAWRYPWLSSSVAPTPGAVTLIDGPLAQQVAGLTGYAMWNDRVYVEFGGYRSAKFGATGPLDSSATGVISGVAPYWRVAWQRNSGKNYFMVGTYGMSANVFPAGVTGPTNRFTDVAVDMGDQLKVGKMGMQQLALHGTWIHETQQWTAGGAANPSNTLNTFRVDAALHLSHRYCLIASPFMTRGSTDSVLYAPAPITGNLTGRPNTNGLITEFDVNAWDNIRVQFQYVAYGTFNGSSTNYDGTGRNASSNNTFYLVAWFVF